jgi:glycosyltransferase involved in cell wall biosynthesis
MYQAADVFAFTSLLETFGMVQIEAMAAGLAVVSTDAPGCRDVVEPGVNGLRAVAGDEASFTWELRRLLVDPALRSDLAAKGRRFAEGYGWESVARRYEDLFAGLAEARR